MRADLDYYSPEYGVSFGVHRVRHARDAGVLLRRRSPPLNALRGLPLHLLRARDHACELRVVLAGTGDAIHLLASAAMLHVHATRVIGTDDGGDGGHVHAKFHVVEGSAVTAARIVVLLVLASRYADQRHNGESAGTEWSLLFLAVWAGRSGNAWSSMSSWTSYCCRLSVCQTSGVHFRGSTWVRFTVFRRPRRQYSRDHLGGVYPREPSSWSGGCDGSPSHSHSHGGRGQSHGEAPESGGGGGGNGDRGAVGGPVDQCPDCTRSPAAGRALPSLRRYRGHDHTIDRDGDNCPECDEVAGWSRRYGEPRDRCGVLTRLRHIWARWRLLESVNEAPPSRDVRAPYLPREHAAWCTSGALCMSQGLSHRVVRPTSRAPWGMGPTLSLPPAGLAPLAPWRPLQELVDAQASSSVGQLVVNPTVFDPLSLDVYTPERDGPWESLCGAWLAGGCREGGDEATLVDRLLSIVTAWVSVSSSATRFVSCFRKRSRNKYAHTSACQP